MTLNNLFYTAIALFQISCYNNQEVKEMTMEQKIGMALAYRGMSQAALAREMGTTPSNFNQKLKRGTFTIEELEKIGEVLGGKYFFGFEFPDGTKV